jgi:uncharacterized membrane protein
MNKADLFYKPLLKEAWGITKKYYWVLLIFITITISVSMALSQDIDKPQNILLSIASVIASIIFGFWSKRLAVWVANNREFKFINIFEGFGNFKNYFITSLIYSLIVLGGFILLIVPGVIWSLKYFMAPYYAIDKGMNYKEALKTSANATNGYKKNIFVFILLMALIIVVSIIPLFLGLLISIPLAFVASGLLYVKLSSNTANTETETVITEPVVEPVIETVTEPVVVSEVENTNNAI